MSYRHVVAVGVSRRKTAHFVDDVDIGEVAGGRAAGDGRHHRQTLRDATERERARVLPLRRRVEVVKAVHTAALELQAQALTVTILQSVLTLT